MSLSGRGCALDRIPVGLTGSGSWSVQHSELETHGLTTTYGALVTLTYLQGSPRIRTQVGWPTGDQNWIIDGTLLPTLTLDITTKLQENGADAIGLHNRK
jgi:hypothetical protein